MQTDFSSRKTVITGGSSGIGKSIVQKLYEAGSEIANADIKAPEKSVGNFFPVNLTRPKEIENFVKEVMDTMGAPEILVCNAGRGVHEKLTEGDPQTWEDIFRLNVFSAFRLIRAFVPQMMKLPAADVVFISSISADHAHPYGGIYTATKAAIEQIAETLRLEVQPDIRITVIRPGVVNTAFFKNMINGNQTPEEIGWGSIDPDQVADSVLFAVSQPKEIMLNKIDMRPAAQTM